MKRRVAILITALLLITVILSFVFMDACASSSPTVQTDPNALQATSVKISKGSKGLVVRMEFVNTGESNITEFAVAFAFWNKNNERLFAFPFTLEGYVNEICYWIYQPKEAIKPGEAYGTEDVFADLADAAEVDVAIRYYGMDSGAYVNIPESQWFGVSSRDGANGEIQDRSYYADPDQTTFEKAKSANIGYHYYLLDDYNAEYYAHSQGGEWIDEIDIGGLGDNAGLMVGDLVISVDGIKPTENIYAVDYAMAKVAAGESVELEYERDGAINTVTLSLEQ